MSGHKPTSDPILRKAHYGLSSRLCSRSTPATRGPVSTRPTHSEADLVAILERAGLFLSPDQVRALLPGASIMQALIEQVRDPLPREAEPAVMFKADQGDD